MPLDSMLDLPWERRVPTPKLLRTCLDTEIYHRLPDDHRKRVDDGTCRFLEQVEILGIADHRLTVHEAVRVAFSCAVLYAGRPEWEFPPKLSVRISPLDLDDRILPCAEGDWGGWTLPRTAEVWMSRKAVDFSFRSADSYHTPIHEFAHVLDFGILEPGRKADGIPRDLGLFRRGAWLATLARVRKRVEEAAAEQVVKRYAAKSPAEAFACVVEAFFEQPGALRGWDGALYRMLSEFLNQDPARDG